MWNESQRSSPGRIGRSNRTVAVAASTNAAFILSRPEIDQKFIWTKGVQVTFVFMAVAYVMGMLFTYIL